MGNQQKPGEKPDRPGEYEERGPRGGSVPKPRQVTIEPAMIGSRRLKSGAILGSGLVRQDRDCKFNGVGWKNQAHAIAVFPVELTAVIIQRVAPIHPENLKHFVHPPT